MYVWPPLPRRVRMRLWLAHRVDAAGIRLVKSGHYEAALRLWRACGFLA